MTCAHAKNGDTSTVTRFPRRYLSAFHAAVRLPPPRRNVRRAQALQRAEKTAAKRTRLGEVRAPGPGYVFRVRARAAEKAHVEVPERALVPALLHTQMTPAVHVVPGPEDDVAAVQTLRSHVRPALDRTEVQCADQRAARRREVPGCKRRRSVEPVAVETRGSDPKDIAEHVCLEVFPEPSEPHRLVELVAVDREDPGVRPREGLDHRVRLSRMRDPSYLEMIELGAELAQDFAAFGRWTCGRQRGCDRMLRRR